MLPEQPHPFLELNSVLRLWARPLHREPHPPGYKIKKNLNKPHFICEFLEPMPKML